MGLATSQVRLLALTSRKADVEMQIQINSKRKTMLTREATELAKLYYAKLQNSKIQYSTTNGYKDINYGYLMAQDTGMFFDQIVSPSSSSSIDRKSGDSMILTDNYGRVILSNSMLDIVLNTLNDSGQNYTKDNRTVESLTIDAMKHLLTKMNNGASEGIGVSNTASLISEKFNKLYNATSWVNSNSTPSNEQYQMGYEMLEYIYENGVQYGGAIYYNSKNGNYYSNYKCNEADKITPVQGNFYIVKNASDLTTLSDPDGSMYWPGSGNSGLQGMNNFYVGLGKTIAGQMSNMFNYYGSIFSAAFNGTKSIQGSDGTNHPEIHFNVAIGSGDIIYNTKTQKYERKGNSKYETATNMENLQDGLKSGVYQLVNVSSKETGGYAKAQGLDYFITQNYIVEKADTSERETITAWYNAARADLSEKETYWDTEITALSSELNTITTEIDSVKNLRKDAIDSTFKWGSA